MGNVLKIKSRTTGDTGAPGSLAQSELAFNEQDDTLYIGYSGNGVNDSTRDKKAIAGVGAFVDLATAQTLTNKTISGDGSGLSGITAGNINGVVPSANLPDASTSVEGVVELATTAETNTGTDTTRAVTPAGLTAWTGDTNLVTVGTISAGTWSGTKLVAGKVPNLNDLTVGGNLSMGTNRITGLGAPTGPNDAARKADVDAAVQGLDVHDSVRVISTVDIPAGNIANNTGAYVVDGVTLAEGDRVLLQNQSPASENGIYSVDTPSGSTHSMQRAADANHADDLSANMFFFVEEGTANADTGWVCTTNGTVSTTNMVFAQFSGTGSFTAGDGLDLTGTAFSADLKANGGVEFQSGEIALNLGSSSITGTLAVADGGTGATTLTTGTVLLGNAASAITQLAKEAAGKILTSEGTAGGDGAVWSNSLSGITIDCGTF
jgi:hypothetical protein